MSTEQEYDAKRRATIESITYEKRMALVSAIKKTIPLESIRVTNSQEMWGFVWLDGLPFCFRAWRQRKRLEYLKNVVSDLETEWGFVHVPYKPTDFHLPNFTEGITEEEMVYMLRGLTERAVRSEPYEKFKDLYWKDPSVRMAYSAAVSQACDERAKTPITS